MIGLGQAYFKSNTFLRNKPTKAPEPESAPSEDKPEGGGRSFYTPEDIGITPESEFEYQQAQEKVQELYGQGPKKTYEPEDIGIGPESEARYQEIAERIQALFGPPKRGYLEEG